MSMGNCVAQTEFDGRMREKCFQPQELKDLIIDQFRGVGLPVHLDGIISVTPKMGDMSCLATALNGRVKISIPHLVHLWAATQQYFLFYSAIVKHAELCKELDQREPWTPDGLRVLQPDLEDAVRQYAKTREDVPYLQSITNYEGRLVCCPVEHCENITALCAAALLWVLLHETSHILCGHPDVQPSPDISTQEEKEADQKATELFFKLCPDNENSRFHYGFGLLIALIELFPPYPHRVGPTYPEYHERLATRLFELDPEENVLLYYLAAFLLEAIIAEWEIPTSDIPEMNVEDPVELAQETVIQYYTVLRDYINNL